MAYNFQQGVRFAKNTKNIWIEMLTSDPVKIWLIPLLCPSQFAVMAEQIHVIDFKMYKISF